MPSHRLLAMLRGENEGFLKLNMRPPEEKALRSLLKRRFVKGNDAASAQVTDGDRGQLRTAAGALHRNRYPPEAKERADDEALRSSPATCVKRSWRRRWGRKRYWPSTPVSGPAARWSAWTLRANFWHNAVSTRAIGGTSREDASQTILDLMQRYSTSKLSPSATARPAGKPKNSSASLNLPDEMPVVMVNESGASIYSASAVGREEFPDQDITVRGAVSIGRRLHGPAGGTGQDRPQIHRGRAIPA